MSSFTDTPYHHPVIITGNLSDNHRGHSIEIQRMIILTRGSSSLQKQVVRQRTEIVDQMYTTF